MAENSGGPHTLIYGVTTNHVTGLEVVLPDGEVVHFGGEGRRVRPATTDRFLRRLGRHAGDRHRDHGEACCANRRRSRPCSAIFETIDDAAQTVSAITAEGITPAALEMLDGWTLRTIEAYCHAGYPLDAAAVLLIELEGLAEAVEEQAEAVQAVCLRQKAREVRRAKERRRASAAVEGP